MAQSRKLIGGAGDDLLVAGFTAFDNDLTALSSIRAQWSNTARNYLTRVNNLRGTGSGASFDARLNGNNFLQNTSSGTSNGAC